MQLLKNQKDFLDSIYAPLGGVKEPAVKVDPHSRMWVYQTNFKAMVFDNLCEDFSSVCEVLGKEKFEEKVKAFLSLKPSSYYSISELGENFPDFLAKNTCEPEYLSDLARLEWLSTLAFRSYEQVSINFDITDQTQIELVPHARLFQSYWDFCDEQAKSSSQMLNYLIFSQAEETDYETICEKEFCFLQKLKTPTTILELEAWAPFLNDFPIDEALAKYVSRGLIRFFN